MTLIFFSILVSPYLYKIQAHRLSMGDMLEMELFIEKNYISSWFNTKRKCGF